SRRRHTRFDCDWSSDVCSSDLLAGITYLINPDLLGLRVFAADPNLKGNDIVNPINTVWTLVAAFLVFGMQVGFTMLEAGFCRSRSEERRVGKESRAGRRGADEK